MRNKLFYVRPELLIRKILHQDRIAFEINDNGTPSGWIEEDEEIID